MSRRPSSLGLLATLAIFTLLACEPKEASSDASGETAAKTNTSTTAPPTRTKTTTGMVEKTGMETDTGVKQVPPDDALSRIDMGSPIIHTIAWQDKNGENALVFARRVRPTPEQDTQDLLTRHVTRAAKTDAWEEQHTMRNIFKKCQGERAIELLVDRWVLSDVDKDGAGEVTFAYNVKCANTQKVRRSLVMVAAGEWYILKPNKMGKRQIPNSALARGPKEFRDHTQQVWRDTFPE